MHISRENEILFLLFQEDPSESSKCFVFEKTIDIKIGKKDNDTNLISKSKKRKPYCKIKSQDCIFY